MDIKLTYLEQKFAEEHHNEVYKFLKYNNLSIEEYYDVVIFGYIKAVADYNRKETARKYTFSACCSRSMNDCLFKYWRAMNTQKRNPGVAVLSLEDDFTDGNGKGAMLEDIVADDKNGIDRFIENTALIELLECCSDLQKRIINLIIDGQKSSVIKRELNIKRNEYEKELAHIRAISKGILWG